MTSERPDPDPVNDHRESHPDTKESAMSYSRVGYNRITYIGDLPKESNWYVCLFSDTKRPRILYFDHNEQHFGAMHQPTGEWLWHSNVVGWAHQIPKRPKWHKRMIKKREAKT